MRNLISIHPIHPQTWITEAQYRKHCGCFRSPKQSSYIPFLCENKYVWACDNDCFVGYNPRRIKYFLEAYQDYASYCTFFNCPDSLAKINGVDVGNAKETLERFLEWEPIIHRLGWRCAFTIQNGMEKYPIPWDECDAIFIGSSDDYRYGTHRSYILEVISEARRLKKWVHVGRVNTINKICYWRDAGASSFDGTKFTREPKCVKWALPFHAFSVRQTSFW